MLDEKHQPPTATTNQSLVAPSVTLGGSGGVALVEATLAEAIALTEKVPTVSTTQQVRVVVPSLEA